jgi:hypothetical protein
MDLEVRGDDGYWDTYIGVMWLGVILIKVIS